MKELKLKLLLVCVLTLVVGTPVALADWDPCEPHKMADGPQLPDPSGWDVCLFHPWFVADDFVCGDDGPITNIHFWISYKGYDEDIPIDPCELEVGICGDDPCGLPDTANWLWYWNSWGGYGPLNINIRYYGSGNQGWYCPWTPQWAQGDHTSFFQVNITDIPDPAIQVYGEHYWLVIYAYTQEPYPVGWKTSDTDNGSPAIWTSSMSPGPSDWSPLDFSPGPPAPTKDLAFVIAGEPNEPEPEPEPGIKWEQLPDPCERGYHCHDGIHMADDWLCEGGLVTDLHWWGSNEYDPNNWAFDISIYADANGFPDGPAGPLWTVTAPLGTGSGQVRRTNTGLQTPFGETIWFYEYYLPDPFPQVADEIYWLDLMAISKDPCNPAGWHWQGNNDPIILSPPVQWYPPAPADSGDYMDFNLAFVITSDSNVPEPEPGIKWQQLPDPNVTGYHCHNGIHMADDWLCEGGLVTDLHWWGSNEYHDNEWGFDISIYADANGLPDASVGPLWTVTAQIGTGPGQVCRTDSGLVHPFYTIWYYEYDLLVPFPQEEGEIYWLDLTAIDSDPCTNPSGWHWQGNNDPIILSPPVQWYPPAPADSGDYVNFNLAFEITSQEAPEPKEPVPNLKWSQPPIEIDPNDPVPRYCGERKESYIDPDPSWPIAADDFRCFGSMPIDSIHWWGSYRYWNELEPPLNDDDPNMIGWRIGFWSNEPAHPNNPWSHPEMLLWQIELDPNRVHCEWVGMNENLDRCFFQYYVDLEPDEVFWQADFLADTEDDIFWLSIAAIYDKNQLSQSNKWGWLSRPWSWMDDGVMFGLDENPEPGMVIDPCENSMYTIGGDLAFELDTDPNWIKWDQPFTGIRHWPHYEDVASWMEWRPEGIAHLTVAADDWKCQGPDPVTALAWWGSYLNYYYHPCDPCFVPPRPEKPAYFDVSIWTDVPDPNVNDPNTWSHPGEVVWQHDVYNYDEVLVGYDKHRDVDPNNEPVFRYTARIPDPNWFWQDPNEQTIYWLSIVAVYEEHHPLYKWGWTNHQHVYNDDAVQTPAMTDPDPAIPWQWNEIHDQTGASADLSFTIYNDPYAEQPGPEEDLDFGDAPDDPCAPMYPTLLVNNGARHIIAGPWLGPEFPPMIDSPDPELDGQPDPCALGDDNDGNDDEDGVQIPFLTEGVLDNIGITVSDPCGIGGIVEIWIDFNHNGDWTDPCEMVFSGFVSSAIGTVWVPVTAPVGSAGTTFARCRISTQGTGSPVGLADDGEVEDHEVYIEGPPPQYDFGDAPDDPCAPIYPTLLANNGAQHIIGGPWFGGQGFLDPGDVTGDVPDPELNGQPDPSALGDDNDGNDDEDGVSIPILVQGISNSIIYEISGSGGGVGVGSAGVDAWIDWNGDGDWDEPGELIYSGVLFDGVFSLGIPAPFDSVVGQTFARWRISTNGSPEPGGLAADGEVEDHEVWIEPPPLDFGDAPDPCYPTLLASNGARHVINGIFPWLGGATDAPDAEGDGQPDPCSLGDDNDAQGDDEDGVVFTSPLVPGQQATVDVTVSWWPMPVASCPLNAWVDFNGDGDWADPCEQIFNNEWVDDGLNSLTFQVPASATGNIYTHARFRIDSNGGLSYTGQANDGEVEDYRVYITCSNCGDFDDNSSIDINDLRILAVNWLWTGAPGGNNIADLNCDGKVDYEDFAIFALQWLGSCP